MKRTCLQKHTHADKHPDAHRDYEFHPVEISFEEQHLDPKEIQQVKSFMRMKKSFLTIVVLVLGFLFAHGQLTGAYTYNFTDGTIISAGKSADDNLVLAGSYSLHGTTYGLDMKKDAQIKIHVSGSCKVTFLGSIYSSLSMQASTVSGGGTVTPNLISTIVATDITDSYIFTYTGGEETLIFTAVADGGQDSDIYLPQVTVEVVGGITNDTSFDFRDGTIITAGKSADANLVLAGSYSLHGTTYGLDMKKDAQIKIHVSGSCSVSFLGSIYSSLSMQATTESGGGKIKPNLISTIVATDVTDSYVFTYTGGEETLIFAAVADGGQDSDVYLPLVSVVMGASGPVIKDPYSYDFKDGTIITSGKSDDGKLMLSGTYNHHGTTYGLDMKLGSEIKLVVSESCTIKFLGSKYSSLSITGKTKGGKSLDPETQSTKVENDLSDTYDFSYVGFADTLIFTVTGSGTDVYLPSIEVIPAETPVAYDFRDGTIITNGKSEDELLTLSGTYKLHGATYGLDMKLGSTITIAVGGSCTVQFLGSAYSSLSMSGETESGTNLIPANLTTKVANDLSDTYEFAYSGSATKLVFTATGSGSDIYLPFIMVAPGEPKIAEREWVKKSGTITVNGVNIVLTAGTASTDNATVTVSEGTVIGASAAQANIRINLGGNALSSYTPTATGDIATVSVNNDALLVTFADENTDPVSYIIIVADNSAVVEAKPGKTYTYIFFDGSEIPQTGYSELRYPTFITQDGIVTINSNTSNSASQFGYHDAAHGLVVFPGNSFDMLVAGNATINFITCQYGNKNDAYFEFTNSEGTVLGTCAARDTTGVDGAIKTFSYTGSKGVVTATLKSNLTSVGEFYLHGLSIENAAEIIASNGKTDVWDFGAQQLDAEVYNNQITESIVNSWYSGSIAVGSAGNVLPNFTAGVLSWVGGSNDRLRTSNTNLTRYDENTSGVADYTGRVYVNGAAATGRFMSLTLSEDDEVTVMALSQSAGGILNFQFVGDPAAQTDVVAMPGELTEFNFVAKSDGTYHLFDSQDKPSYYRIYRKDASYITLTGAIDVSMASGIPSGYSISFTNEAGKTWRSTVNNNAYSVKLPMGFTYSLSLADANGYVISNGSSLAITETTNTYAITVQQVELYTLSGSIIGLADKIAKLQLTFTPDPSANKIYIPEPVIDANAATYSVQLEPNCNYTISALGVNDFQIPANVVSLTANKTGNIAFAEKTKYKLSVTANGLNAEQLGKLALTFTNLNEKGYAYSFASINDISLRDGTYSIAYSGIDEYPVEMERTSNATIEGAATSKTLTFNTVSNWTFDDKVITTSTTAYKGLLFSGISNEIAKGHIAGSAGATIQIPVNAGDKIRVTYYYSADFSIDGGNAYTTASGSTLQSEYADYAYTGNTPGMVTVTIGSGATKTYITNIEIGGAVDFQSVIYVGTNKTYKTINEGLAAVAKMIRSNNERVTIMIDPGDYEEMLVVNQPNITLKNASVSPSIALKNKGVDIDDNAVRITSYYGHGYNYYSMGSDQKWHADLLRVNKENGYLSYENKGSGTTNGSYWNATVVVSAAGFIADNIIFENSFNQYISKKESDDVVVMWESGNKGERPTDFGNTSVQNRSFVERAAAISFVGADKAILYKCRIVGRQDSFYGGTGRVVAYKGSMMGAVDYIFGAMTATFYKSDLVMNVSDVSGDAAYLTAAQQSTGRGYLMYECNVKSAAPGTESASTYSAQPGMLGRPWQATTSEVVFYNTNIETTNFPGSEGKSLISPAGWSNSLGGTSSKMYEYGTIEKSGENNQASRVSWSTILAQPKLTDGTDITTFNFTKGSDDWDPIPALIAEDINGVYNLQSTSSVGVYGNGNRIYISNVKTGTKVIVYALNGSVVRTMETNVNTNFSLNRGIYLVKVIAADGLKTVKVAVR